MAELRIIPFYDHALLSTAGVIENNLVKLLLAIIAIIAACLFTISKLHDDGTMILASMAEEYSVCTNVNACSDEDLAEMTDLLLEQDEYNSRMWLRVMLGWEHWRD